MDGVKKILYMNLGIIILEGGIGTGKSTLGKSIVEYYNSKGLPSVYLPEFGDIDLLNYYISHMKEFAFSFQTIMIRERINLINKALRLIEEGKYLVVVDRGIIGDLCFAKMLHKEGYISDEQYKIYGNLATLDSITNGGGVPIRIVYLRNHVDVLLKRIKKRGIESEIKGYNNKYLEDLLSIHDALLLDPKKSSEEDDVVSKIIKHHGLSSHFSELSSVCKIVTLDYSKDFGGSIDNGGVLSNDIISQVIFKIFNI